MAVRAPKKLDSFPSNFNCIDLCSKEIKILPIKKEWQEACLTYGSTSHWFDNHTLVIISGCRPRLGHGFRSIYCYSKYSNREMLCDSATCMINQTTGNVAWVMCSICSRWIHNFCDPLTRNRTTVLKTSEIYHCQQCREHV